MGDRTTSQSFRTIRRLSRSEAETVALATEFAASLSPGDWVGLIGPLGAGKSVFARALGRTWDVTRPMPSPTFTLMAVHQGRCPIYHMDFYRLASEGELDSAELLPYFSASGICLVEWADRIRSVWPARGWTVTITPRGSDERDITIAAFGAAEKT